MNHGRIHSLVSVLQNRPRVLPVFPNLPEIPDLPCRQLIQVRLRKPGRGGEMNVDLGLPLWTRTPELRAVQVAGQVARFWTIHEPTISLWNHY